MPKTAPPTAPKKAQIEKYLAALAKMRQLQREARSHARIAAELGSKLMAFAKAAGGKKRTVETCGFVLALIKKRLPVVWKVEFVRLAGVEEAEKLIKAAPQKDTLSVTPTK